MPIIVSYQTAAGRAVLGPTLMKQRRQRRICLIAQLLAPIIHSGRS